MSPDVIARTKRCLMTCTQEDVQGVMHASQCLAARAMTSNPAQQRVRFKLVRLQEQATDIHHAANTVIKASASLRLRNG